MKKIVLFLTVIIFLSANSLTANNQDSLQKKDTIHAGHHQKEKSEMKESHAMLKVEGKCDMCKKRIETAALNVEGVSSAIWEKRRKNYILTLTKRKHLSRQ